MQPDPRTAAHLGGLLSCFGRTIPQSASQTRTLLRAMEENPSPAAAQVLPVIRDYLDEMEAGEFSVAL